MLINMDRKVFVKGSAVAKRLARLGEDGTKVDSVTFSKTKHGIQDSLALSDNVHVYPTNSHSRLFYGLDVLACIRRLPRPDVISAQDAFETGLVAYVASLLLHVPFVVEVHTDFLSPAYARHSLLNRIRIAIAAFVLSRAVGSYAVSESVKRSVEARFALKRPMEVLPIFVDLARYRSIQRAKEKGLLLWIGRFEKEKEPCAALDALAYANADGKHLKLVMLGAGSLEAELKAHVTLLGISDLVSFPGWEDTAPYLARAELLLVTSKYEGFGMAMVEALAAGVPVLSTDVGVAREAGAVIAGKDYARSLCELLDAPLGPVSLQLPLYCDEEEYLSAVRAFYISVASRSPRASLGA